MKHLTVEQVLKIHARQIEMFGGKPGVRDMGLVESAVARPRAGFGGESLYQTLEDKATALAFSLVMNMPSRTATSGRVMGRWRCSCVETVTGLPRHWRKRSR